MASIMFSLGGGGPCSGGAIRLTPLLLAGCGGGCLVGGLGDPTGVFDLLPADLGFGMVGCGAWRCC